MSTRTKSGLSEKTMKLVLGGILIAAGTVLSFLKISDLPYGGSVTICAMVPVMLFAYLFGVKWGVFAALSFGVLQLLLGSSVIKGMTAGAAILMVLLDYIVAYGTMGFAGVFRNKVKSDSLGMALGAAFSAFLRYVVHIISGVIFWSDYATWFFEEGGLFGDWALANLNGGLLSFFYSIVYNGLYMIPELIVSVVGGFLIMKFAGNSFQKMIGQA